MLDRAPGHGKVALVTGSSGGIGLAAARALAKQGFATAVHGLASQPELEDLRREMEDLSGKQSFASSADLSSPEGARTLLGEALERFGRVDVLVNNAGVQHVAPIEDFPLDKWNAIIAINLSAAFHATAMALPGMKKRGWGRIINVASAHGLVASPFKAAYVAAKHGLIGLTKVTALECARTGVTCNAICPGWVKTPLVEKQIEARAKSEGLDLAQAERDLLSEKQPSLRFVEPEELGALVAFLASDASASMTGASLTMDGGWTAQ